ncbi:hypothetical protein V3851_25665 [Paenibacillus sp. M1]|uniref:Uncharacterized protein n=1 Tax=Paenibacillus haidiansis TaxID=1574488 RepID=A0ABU7W0Y3_9BACL
MVDDNNRMFNPPDNPYAAKAHFDTNVKKLRTEGIPGLWRQISNLLIVVAIFAVIILIVSILG